MKTSKKRIKQFFSEEYKKKLSREIDELILRIESNLRAENEDLKRKVDSLSAENLRLKGLLSDIAKDSKTSEFFNILANEKAVH